MSIITALESCKDQQIKRNWSKVYWFFDIHGTILKPNYEYGNIPNEFYPYAKEVLQHISTLDDVCMILYTCSHPNEIEEYLKLFKENNINFKYVNENPEVQTQINGYGCYDSKPYMNLLLEDKAGFDPYTDWQHMKNWFKLGQVDYYSNFALESQTQISTNIYGGEFKCCTENSVIYSKPFKIEITDDHNYNMLSYKLLEGDFTDDEIIELLETLK